MKQLSLVSAVRASMGRQAGYKLLVAGVATLVVAPAMAEPLMDDYGYEIEIPIETFRDVTYMSQFEFGLGHISEETVKFGEFNSMEGKGVYLLGSFDILSREPHDSDEWATYFSARGRHLLTDSSEVQLTIGRQGDYRFDFELDRTEKQFSRTYLTPYYDTSDPNNLAPPAGWVGLSTISDQLSEFKRNGDPNPNYDPAAAADNIAANTTLLRPKSLSARRDSYAIGYQKALTKYWTVTADVSREFKQGSKDYGFYAGTPMIVPEPIDYRTDQITLGVEHLGKSYQYQIKYYLSQFDNENPALSLISAGNGSYNAMALPPSNDFQQLSFNGNYRISDVTRATFFTSYSLGRQEEDLLTLSAGDPVTGFDNSKVDDSDPATPDGSFAPTKADIERETMILQLGLSSRVTRDLSLSGKYRWEDKDADIQDVAYAWTILDNASGAARGIAQTIDLDSETHRFNLDGALRLPKMSKLRLGYELEQIKRTNQDQEETEEHSFTANYKLPTIGGLMATIDLARRDRDGEKTYDPNASKFAIHDPVVNDDGRGGKDDPNPNIAGSQKYNLADREQEQYGVTLSYPLSNALQVSASAKLTQDDYDKTDYGLQDVDSGYYSLDLSYAPNRTSSVHVYYGVQTADYRQTSAHTDDHDGEVLDFDWYLDTEDTAQLFGSEFKMDLIPNRLAMSFGYRYSWSTAEIAHGIGTVREGDKHHIEEDLVPLPDIQSNIHTFDISAEYHLDAQSSIKAQWLYERYKSKNFAYDDLGPLGTDATPYLAGGIESPNHSVHFVGLSYKRAF